ncbi:YihY/virulence factor BrkB family protein [Gloeobacter kilaueensis]|uniref:Ribonuclease BN n=1 Tax=Gloeobacter kilaueensis (strain ATCC BAA-2537 / CCAP 1431/1 / ULC 316 / JS1) TaxID=1183438 RepID=U5QH26_GLOK1|nr:YihY/virulence factor BrkB family protein [Gloeobacter kilaueensis]AGY58193.1 ribonuclease BN [Gloeobacter kilaueensis JS1]
MPAALTTAQSRDQRPAQREPFYLGAVPALLREAIAGWSEDKVPRLSAALAYYTFFSLAPLLVVVIAVAGAFFGPEAIRGQLDNQLTGLIGPDSAGAVQELVRRGYQPASGIVASVIAVATILFGVSGLFSELQDALNTIWGVKPRPDRSWKDVLKERFVSFSIVFVIALALLASLIVSAVISAVTGVVGAVLPLPDFAFRLIDTAVSLGLTTLMFAAIYKILPDVKLAWKDVLVAAGITSVLFVIGKALISLYLGYSTITSAYGAAGSLVVILVWVFYSVQVMFFGAEVAKVYTRKHGSGIVPARNAMLIADSNPQPADTPAPAPPQQQNSEPSPPKPPGAIKRTAAFMLSFLVLARRLRS